VELKSRRRRSGSSPPILLFDAGYYGTLAAARALGRAGVEVVLADPLRATPARFSRYVGQTFVCPPVTRADELVDWLLAFGAREGTHVVYPTSDEIAYLLSAHREELSKDFILYAPPVSMLLRALDKKALFELGRRSGFDVPWTRFPETLADVERAASEADGPLMIKPRTQLFLKTHRKGALASTDPLRLAEEYRRFEFENTYGPRVARDMPELAKPILQHFFPEAAQSIHSVTGFRARRGGRVVTLGAVKVLQRPRTMGVGLCFEPREVNPGIRTALERFLQDLDYFGVFEIELVASHDRLFLIDFNPRLYNQLALDIGRGLNLPLLAYRAALDDDAEVERLLESATEEPGTQAFCNSVGVYLQLGAQRVVGTMSAEEVREWRCWMRERRDSLIDAVKDSEDPMPFWVEAASQLLGSIRHPRAFLRMIAFDR
jgi:D-aspartate ligase